MDSDERSHFCVECIFVRGGEYLPPNFGRTFALEYGSPIRSRNMFWGFITHLPPPTREQNFEPEKETQPQEEKTTDLVVGLCLLYRRRNIKQLEGVDKLGLSIYLSVYLFASRLLSSFAQPCRSTTSNPWNRCRRHPSSLTLCWCVHNDVHRRWFILVTRFSVFVPSSKWKQETKR